MRRREALAGIAVVASAVSAAAEPTKGVASAKRADAKPYVPGAHTLVPLPFTPSKLVNISEKMITSLHENNYGGALKNLNKVEADIATLPKDAPGYLVAALKEKELTFTNSVILHELYFGNLGGPGKPSGSVEKAIADTFGTFGKWEEQFRATCTALGGGSGWVMLDFNFHTANLRTYWSGNHTQAVAFGAPLLVMDMYEHAYHLDFGAAAARYVDAFFQNIQWDEVSARYERAATASAALRL